MVALVPDITMMLVNRVFYQSPADLYMIRMKVEQERPGFLAEYEKMMREKRKLEEERKKAEE